MVAARREPQAWEPLHLEAARQAIRPVTGLQGVDGGSWQQRWGTTAPRALEVNVDGRNALDHRVYLARVVSLGISRLMAAKMMALQPGDADALIPHLQGELYTARRVLSRLPAPLLRDAVYGQLVGGAARAQHVLVSPQSLMTLHPLAEGSLQQLLDALDKVPVAECEPIYRHIAGQLADELKRCVDRSVVHNDIKPANILFWRDGSLRLNDFGSSFGTWDVARIAVEDMPVSVDFSPAFEHWHLGYADAERAYPHARDIFGLGATLWTLIAGDSPMRCALNDDAIASSRYRWLRNYTTVRSRCTPFSQGATMAQPLPSGLAETTQRLVSRAPTLAPLIVDMLHPLAYARPTIEEVVARLPGSFERRADPVDPFAAWLSQNGVLTGARRPGPGLWSLAARTPGRPRSHSEPALSVRPKVVPLHLIPASQGHERASLLAAWLSQDGVFTSARQPGPWSLAACAPSRPRSHSEPALSVRPQVVPLHLIPASQRHERGPLQQASWRLAEAIAATDLASESPTDSEVPISNAMLSSTETLSTLRSEPSYSSASFSGGSSAGSVTEKGDSPPMGHTARFGDSSYP